MHSGKIYFSTQRGIVNVVLACGLGVFRTESSLIIENAFRKMPVALDFLKNILHIYIESELSVYSNKEAGRIAKAFEAYHLQKPRENRGFLLGKQNSQALFELGIKINYNRHFYFFNINAK